MRSLSLGNTDMFGIMGTIKMPKTEKGKEWLSTLIINKANGNAQGEVLADNYAVACEQNSRMNKVKREIEIVMNADIENGDSVPAHCVTEDVLGFIDDRLDDLADRDDFVYSMRQIIELDELLLIEEGVSLIELLKGALNKASDAVKRVIELKDKYGFDDVLRTVLSQEGWLQYLERECENR